MSLSLCISVSFWFVTVSELFCCEFFQTFVKFDISLLYYFNLSSSVISCLSSGEIYISLSISLSCLSVTVSKLFYCKCFDTPVILSAILLPIKSPVTFAVLWMTLFEEVSVDFSRLFSMIKKFLAIFTTQVFTYIFANNFNHIFSKRQKPIAFYKYWISHHFLYFTFWLITRVMFILSFISSGLEF